jgi:ATP-binding cassette subfamily B protein
MTPAPPPATALRRVTTGVRRQLVLAVAIQALAALAGVVPYIAVAELAVVLADDPSVAGGQVWPYVAVACGAAVLALAGSYAAATISHYADNRMQLGLRRDLASHLGRLPLGWFSARGTGRVTTAVHDDVHALHHLVAHTLLDVTVVLTGPVAALVYLFTVDWRLALLSAAVPALGFVLFRRAMAGAGEKMAHYQQARIQIAARAVEFADGAPVVKSFGRQGTAHGRFTEAADDFSRFFSAWSRGTLKVSTAAFLVVSPVVVLAVVLGTGAQLVLHDALPPADLIAFALLAPSVAAPIGAVGTRLQQIHMGQAAAGRIVELLDEPPLHRATEPKQPDGHHVRMRGVHFSYDAQHEALRGVDLDLEPGTVTALVGASGAGKSTVAALLPRFHDADAGTITIGGVNIRDIAPEVLYRTVGFVFQDVRLLRRTVADNIRLGRPDASLEDVRRAARAAQIDDRILDLPHGYDSMIGADAEFSGGEAQRISIARALLTDAPILILDEATAFADPRSEARIQQALGELAVGRTVLVIAHRLETVRAVDRILVLDGGRVVEQGRHDDLIAADGHYAHLWQRRVLETATGTRTATATAKESA